MLDVGEERDQRDDPAPARRAAVRAQRLRASPATSSACGATRSRSSRRTRSAAVRISLFGDEVERICAVDPLTGEVIEELDALALFPASHYVTDEERLKEAIAGIEVELAERLAELEGEGKLLEAQRLRMRTTYDLEMLREVGSCCGRRELLDAPRRPRRHQPPYTLLDYFPDDWLCVLDESHVAIPQLHGQFEGDRSRKETLVDHGFRLPSAMDNRPLRFEEFTERVNQVVFLSATPGKYEREISTQIVEQVVRPTGSDRSRGDREAHQGPDRRPRRARSTCAPRPISVCSSRRSRRRCRRTSPTICSSSASGCATCTPRSTRSSASRSCARCGSASSTCSSASTCCERVSTCPRCRSSRSSTPTRRASCARPRR